MNNELPETMYDSRPSIYELNDFIEHDSEEYDNGE